MSLYHKIFLAIALALLAAPFSVHAQAADYLIVTAEFENAMVVSVMADQQALNEPLPIVYANGTYQIQLYSGAEIIGRNYFEVPLSKKHEVIGQSTGSDGERVYGEFTPSSQIAQVPVPILKSVDPEVTGLKILKGDLILFDKKLSAIPLNVISAASVRVLVKDPPPPNFTSSEQMAEASPEATAADEYNPNNESRGGWLVIILLIIGAAYLVNKKGWLEKIKNKFLKK